MTNSILGKRSRSIKAGPARSTRSKRSILIYEDQNDIEKSNKISPAHNNECMLVDKIEENHPSPNSPTNNLTSSKLESLTQSFDTSIHRNQTEAEGTPEETHLTPSSTPRALRYQDVLPNTPKNRDIGTKSPKTPQTPQTHAKSSRLLRSVYNDARKVFNKGADPGALIGREKERAELTKFISQHIEATTGGSLYVSGPPGTGKSALVQEVLKLFENNEAVKSACINCMSIKSPEGIYASAAESLGILEEELASNQVDVFRSKFVLEDSQQSFLVVLDEIDQLLQIDLQALYNFFEWSFSPGSRLILIGIANALDLTDRFLPRLKARNLRPLLLPFLPYAAKEIASVLTSRCRSLLPQDSSVTTTFTPFLHPTAIQLISKKVATQTGDLRRAFEIAQQIVDLIETETRDKLAAEAMSKEAAQSSPSRTPLSENNNLSSPPHNAALLSSKDRALKSRGQKELMVDFTIENAPRAMLPHVVRVTSSAFGNSIQQRLKGLNIQQKAILCCLVAIDKRNQKNDSMIPSPQQSPEKQGSAVQLGKQCCRTAPSMRALHELYTTSCKRNNILQPLSSTEFRDVITSLETASLVNAADGKLGSLVTPMTPSKRGKGNFGKGIGDNRKLAACVSLKDLESALEGPGSAILKCILNECEYA